MMRMRTIAGICLSLIFVQSTALADQASRKQQQVASGTRASLSGGNGIYTVYLDDHNEFDCGAWTATTAGLHPAGGGFNVLFGGGFPGTSNTVLRSYTSGTDYSTAGLCTDLCGAATSASTTAILNGATTVGFRTSWSLVDSGNIIEFIQEVVVEGPVNGTETVDNTVIRETHTVRNSGPGSISFGLKKHWDWQIGSDDGPWFGDCETPSAACDRSMNLTGDGTLDGPYPQSYVINEDPASASCPGILVPNNPAGCAGLPLYIVAGTVEPPSLLTPPPDAPELLQFNEWGSLFFDCWQPALFDNATCAGGDTASAYFYGLTAATAEVLAAGDEKSFTQYVVAGEETCPDIIAGPVPDLDIKPGSCPNSFNRNSHGVLPVSLLGTESFDVTQVDLDTIQLCRADALAGCVAPHAGPPGPHSVFSDTGTPFDGELCDCHELTGDGVTDLSMKFKTDGLVAALQMNDFSPGALVELTVSGNLLDGTPFEASDCVRLVPPGSPPGLLAVVQPGVGQSSYVEISPLDDQLDGGGFGDFERTFPQSTVSSLEAADSAGGKRFVGWKLDGIFDSTDFTFGVTVEGMSQSIEAVYRLPGDIIADDTVNLVDFAQFANCFGQNAPSASCAAEFHAASDLNRDGKVDLIDFSIFALNFGG